MVDGWIVPVSSVGFIHFPTSPPGSLAEGPVTWVMHSTNPSKALFVTITPVFEEDFAVRSTIQHHDLNFLIVISIIYFFRENREDNSLAHSLPIHHSAQNNHGINIQEEDTRQDTHQIAIAIAPLHGIHVPYHVVHHHFHLGRCRSE